MPALLYCWRCRVDTPMLTEDEWRRISPSFTEAVTLAKHRGRQPGESLAEARSASTAEVLDLFEELTGFRETNINAIYHHRLGLYGPACGKCAKPLRTPQARFCAMCDWKRPEGGLVQTAPGETSA